MAESSSQAEQTVLPKWVVAIIALLALPAFFLGLTVPFIGPDEPRYAEVGREMFQSGDWITPTLAGFHWFEKPPLLYWFEAVFYSIFGVNEFAARLGPALCGLAIIGCLWLLGRLALPNEKAAANWFVIVGVSTLGLITFAHAATTDVVVTLPLTMAMVAFFIFDERLAASKSGAKLYLPLVVMYAAAGVALLAKGLIGLIFPPAIILVYLILSRRLPSRTLLLSALWGIPLTLAVASIWYVPMYVRYGNEFVHEFIIRQHFERFTTNVFQHPQPFYFYLYVLPLLTLPWLPFFLIGVWKAVGKAFTRDANPGGRSSLQLFALGWLIVPIAFFSLSVSKLPGYILPALPAAIIFSGLAAWDLSRKRIRWTWVSAGMAGATLIVVTILLVTVFPERAAQESVKPLLNAADQRGLGSTKILLMHADNFSAEYYAGDRLPRDAEGKQHKLYGSAELDQAIRNSLGPTLVVVPKKYTDQVIEDVNLRSELLAENRDHCILVIFKK